MNVVGQYAKAIVAGVAVVLGVGAQAITVECGHEINWVAFAVTVAAGVAAVARTPNQPPVAK